MSEQAMTFGEALCAMEKGEELVSKSGSIVVRYKVIGGCLMFRHGGQWKQTENDLLTLMNQPWSRPAPRPPPTEYPIELWQAVKIMQEGEECVFEKDGRKHVTGVHTYGNGIRKVAGTVWDIDQGLNCRWFTTTPPEPEPSDVDKRIAEAGEKERKRCSTLAYEQWAQSKRDEDTAIKNKDYGVASCAQHAQLVLDCLRRNIELVSL